MPPRIVHSAPVTVTATVQWRSKSVEPDEAQLIKAEIRRRITADREDVRYRTRIEDVTVGEVVSDEERKTITVQLIVRGEKGKLPTVADFRNLEVGDAYIEDVNIV